jgi:hypothetical protein
MVGVFIFIYLVIGFRHAQRKVNNPNPALRLLWASDMSLSQLQRLLRFWAVILLFPLSIDADRRSNTTQETFTPLIILIVSYMIFEVFSYRTGAVFLFGVPLVRPPVLNPVAIVYLSCTLEKLQAL